MQKVGAFRGKLSGFLNGGAAALMISIGHQTGLFDHMAANPPGTSEQIAEAAGLDERYVREWLGAMLAAGVLTYNTNADTYTLPSEHAALLTRDAGTANMALHLQYLPLLATVQDQIVDKFHNGGGVPYSEYGDFHRIMGEVSGARIDETLVSVTLPLMDGVIDQLQAGIDVADVGCGSGHAINVMAKAFPNSRFTGYDFSAQALEVARSEATDMGVSNATFVEMDAAKLDVSKQFDFITAFDAIHDQAHPRQVVKNINNALKDNGTWLCVDIRASSHVNDNCNHPIGVFGYTVSTMHCMTVSLAYDGEGLGTMWGVHTAREIFAEAGFSDVTVHNIDADPGNNYYVCKK